MERKEINEFYMLKTTSVFMERNQILIAGNPEITARVNLLNSKITEIERLMDVQATTTTGNSLNKKQTETALISASLKISAGILAHSATTNDLRLKEVASVSETSLKRLRDNDLITTARSLSSNAKPIVRALNTWGVTAEDLDQLDSLISAYSSVIPENTADSATSKQSTADIKAKLKEAKTLLKEQLDPMMLPFKTLNPTFLGQYENARQIIDTAATHSTKENTVNPENK